MSAHRLTPLCASLCVCERERAGVHVTDCDN